MALELPKLRQGRSYQMTTKYFLLIKEEMNRLLEASIIFPVSYNEFVSPIIVVPEKNGKLQICVDYQKLNGVTKNDYSSLPITNFMLDEVLSYGSFYFIFILFWLIDGFQI